MKDKIIVYGIAMVGPGAEIEKPANVYNVEQKKLSTFGILYTVLDLFIKNKHSIVVDATFIPEALKDKITFVPNREDHGVLSVVPFDDSIHE
ncbi:hypothetical protein AtubIFM56815_001242 [Aspergillus tubingensis]|uniref:Uncharacterized protein n=1 Tax=Aspergillus tubingensis TaxID=5068 RepID=A0A9W6AFY9_ASPTU|nr:hypothetical protein AtubIFM56815_001242 [Aspergillus tubingensis]GLB22280.1 hypothetical protein AtubIFM61612_002842 [Aspergillus tubingensis]